MNGQYDSQSEPDDFCWSIEENLSGGGEARLTVHGFKYPIKSVGGHEALSKHDLSCDITVGERWGRYVTVDFGGFRSDPESALNDIDKTIAMLQAGREKYVELMTEFPKQNWSPDNG